MEIKLSTTCRNISRTRAREKSWLAGRQWCRLRENPHVHPFATAEAPHPRSWHACLPSWPTSSLWPPSHATTSPAVARAERVGRLRTQGNTFSHAYEQVFFLPKHRFHFWAACSSPGINNVQQLNQKVRLLAPLRLFHLICHVTLHTYIIVTRPKLPRNT